MEAMDREFAKRLWGLLHELHDPGGMEAWLSQHPEMRVRLGEEIYESLTRYPARNSQAEHDLLDRLAAWALSSPVANCPCSTWKDDQRVGLGYETATLADDWFADLKSRTPWLDLVRCKRCGQHWYLATDTVDDELYFLRLSAEQVNDIVQNDKWPTRFDELESVWPEQGS